MSTTPNLASVVESPTVRKIIYTVFVVAVVLVGATQVAYAAVELAQPDLLTQALAVLGYLGVPVGGLALANTPSRQVHGADHQ